jgi:protease I
VGTELTAPVAFLAAAEGTEQSELQHPWDAVIVQGARPVLVSPSRDEIRLFEHLDRVGTMLVDVPVGEARAEDYAGLVLPGGVANPDQLRADPAAVAFASSFFEAGKPVAAICHARGR